METAALAPYKVVTDGIKEAGGEAFKSCYQYGLRDIACPWNRVRRFFVGRIIHEAE